MNELAEQVQYEKQGSTALVVINRVAKKNAITAAMYGALADAFGRAENDPSIRCIVLTGAGNAFTAGNDIRDFKENPPLGLDAPLYRFLKSLVGASKVVISAVEGVAAGIGTTALLHCDLVVAGRSARFLLPFVNIGLVPEAGSSLLFPALVGGRVAAKHLILAEPFDGNAAVGYGLVTELVDDGSALERARQLAEIVAAKAPIAVQHTKKLLRRQNDVWAAVVAEAQVYADRLRSAETKEAISAFLEKRAAKY